MIADQLRALDVCDDAIEWASGYTDPGTAWAECQRGDWMLWLLGRLPPTSRQAMVLAACECARLALHHVPAGEDRPRIAIETAEAWVRGEATIEDVRAAADAADAVYAARTARTAAANAAAASAVYAAYLSAEAANAAAASAVYAAYLSADTSDASAARKAVLAQCAGIVRKHFPVAPRLTTEQEIER